jgi:AcrR family transcriptional regulator
MTLEPPRRMGRPDQQASEELVRHIVDTATRLFIEQGYAATSIEQVAAAAGAGKQTIYRRFTSKEGLFTEVINRQAARLMEITESVGGLGGDPIEALKESCRRLFDFLLKPDVISLQRIMHAEIVRFPEMGEYVLENCMTPFKSLLNRFILAAAATGQIQVEDAHLTQALLIGLLTGWPTQQSMLCRQPFATDADRDAFFEAAWRLFLNGAR